MESEFRFNANRQNLSEIREFLESFRWYWIYAMSTVSFQWKTIAISAPNFVFSEDSSTEEAEAEAEDEKNEQTSDDREKK